MPKFITPVDVTPTADGTWNDVDVTTHVGSDAGSVAGVILQVVNGTGSNDSAGFRKNGSTDTFTDIIVNANHTYIYVGVDSGDIFEANLATGTGWEVHLKGYVTADEGSFFDNAVDKSTNTTDSYEDVDISGDTGADTAVVAFGFAIGAPPFASREWVVRNNGSTDDLYGTGSKVNRMEGYIMGVDGSEIFEQKINHNSNDLHVTGYLTANATAFTNGKDYSTATTATYENVDFSADIPADNIGAFGQIHIANNATNHNVALRKNGATFDEYNNTQGHFYPLVEIDGSRIAEQKVATTNDDLWLNGYVSEPASAQTAIVGLSTETDTAFAITALKTATVGLSSETDTGLALTGAKTATVGLSTETDTAFAITHAKTAILALATETDTGLALTALKTVPIGLATETDTAFALTYSRAAVLALATETDTAFAVTGEKAATIGLATGTESALTLSAIKTAILGLATETDSALALATGTTIILGLASETDTGFAVTGAKTAVIGLAADTETAFAITPLKTAILGLATETDSAFVVSQFAIYTLFDRKGPSTTEFVAPLYNRAMKGAA